MMRIVLLDAGPLSQAIHPRPEQNRAILRWISEMMMKGVEVSIPSISDYEVRRKLLHLNKTASIERLDLLKRNIGCAEITDDVMIRAAEFWAAARKAGMPTAGDKALDGDVILAAQADILASSGIETIIATENVGHLSRYVKSDKWKNIS